MNLSRLTSSKTVTLHFGEDKLKIGYNQKEYTPKLEREMNEKMKANLPGAMLSTMLIKVLESWDLVSDVEMQISTGKPDGVDPTKPGFIVVKKGAVLPINEYVLDEILSISVQARIVEALAEDQRPNETRSGKPDDTF